ncbi:MAG: lipid-A-disaccharide synthase [Myxococcota bacterium]
MKVFISAAEPSGDRIAAALMTEWKKMHPVEFVGISGPLMRKVGLKTIQPMEEFMAMGIVDVLKRLPQIVRARRLALQCLTEVAQCICIDAPDFHLPILNHAKQNKIRAVGIVSPQIWAWRRNRASKIARKMDQLLCLFDFEPSLYPSGFDARFVGHPIQQWTTPRTKFTANEFAFFPGSRPQEIKRHLPLYVQTAHALKRLNPEARFTLSLPQSVTPPLLPKGMTVHHNGAQMARSAQAALCKSGTITLELACMNVPMVVAHRVHPITYWIGRTLLKGVKHISLPNILSQRLAVPEFIQPKDPSFLARQLYHLPNKQKINFSPITSKNAIQSMLKSIISHTE